MTRRESGFFSSLKPYWTGAVLVVLNPYLFYQEYPYLNQQKRKALLHALPFVFVSSFIFDLVSRYFEVSHSLPSFWRSTWASVLEIFILNPLLFVLQVAFFTAMTLFVSMISRSGFGCNTTFNLFCSFAPYLLWMGVGAGLLTLVDLYLGFFSGWMLAGVFGVLLLFLLLANARTFHEGAKMALRSGLITDPAALLRFYWVLVSLTLGVGVLCLLLGIMMAQVLFA
jgi:hypothetical protein